MGKVIPDAILDLMLTETDGTHFAICSAEPANYADIANVDLVNTAITGSFTAANGDTNGRKRTMPAQTAKSIIASGTGTHLAVHNNTDTMYKVTTVASQALTSGGTTDTNAWDHELADVT